MFRMHLCTNHLTDGSETYDVHMTHEDHDEPMVIQAVTMKDAVLFMDKVTEAFEAHTNTGMTCWPGARKKRSA